jgi:hypothetical protein
VLELYLERIGLRNDLQSLGANLLVGSQPLWKAFQPFNVPMQPAVDVADAFESEVVVSEEECVGTQSKGKDVISDLAG